ncbi:MAG: saccharopine dehydrogenase NADP-binding domain-containing protein, partial [Gemmatimonadaceae bacterium]|nr:saccharopine dehydrogenase NADP-binding domain-containing protein [Chitinophagaceae bacterium]
MTKTILLIGAGKSATVLINYLEEQASQNDWQLVIADYNPLLAASKITKPSYAKAVALDVANGAERTKLIAAADIVISLLPPVLHFIIAKDCIQYRKNLLTASYVDDNMRSLENEIEKEGLLFLCEMGLDPGIDHMSAMKLLNHIRSEGGHVSSFRSHCGGLVAPESDDNPWRYKISWNPRNVVFAGKAGATFRENGAMRMVEYKELFDANRVVNLPELGYLAWYPNRDSLSYTSIYGLTDAETFVRTTLRFPEFCFGWKHIIDLKLTDETPAYNTAGMSLREFFRLHFEKHGFSD